MALLVPVVLLPDPPKILIGVCYIALFLNLFNLIPVRPLDGGRILQATGKVSRYLAIAAVLLLPLLFQEVFFMLFWIVGLKHLNLNLRLKVALGLLVQASILALQLAGVGAIPWT